jgi:hypothetical protein
MLLGRSSRKGILRVGHCRGRRDTRDGIYLDGVGAVVADRTSVASRYRVSETRDRKKVDLLLSRTFALDLHVSTPRSL